MKPFARFAAAWACLMIALPAAATQFPLPSRTGLMLHGGPAGQAKAVVDTIALMGPTGSGAVCRGDFEGGWNRWTSLDVTANPALHWQVSDYQQTGPGDLAAWCGSATFAACSGTPDLAGGYGNNWHQLLQWRQAVSNPSQGVQVRVQADLQIDTEPGYDHVYLSARREGEPGYVDFGVWDGHGVIAVDQSFSYEAGELVGGSEVIIGFRFLSDGAYSDADCGFRSAGALQVDDITVTLAQAGQADLVSLTDFQDATFGAWEPVAPVAVGDFAALWSGLEDADPCRTNNSSQVAFIDDGLVVPGTGGSNCLNWCYGPNGFIVNTTGGLAGPAFHLQNDILSPVMAWPAGDYDGLSFAFDAYQHETLGPGTSGMFFTWGVRSADTDNSAGRGAQVLADQPFRDFGYVIYGSPAYVRHVNDVSSLLVAGRDEVQIRLGVNELGHLWNWDGDDGTPAPYFDHVALKAYGLDGPVLTANPAFLAQDNFPEIDTLDTTDLGTLHVRFDAAASISHRTEMRNDPGDSLVVAVRSLRSGAELAGVPEMHYVIRPNPLFDAYRLTAISGVVAGWPVAQSIDRWAFDLPDTGTLFPGDVLQYYFQAGDIAAGDLRYATLPADLTGFGDFATNGAYDPLFTVRALPSISSSRPKGPRILIWDDSGEQGAPQGIHDAMLQICLYEGDDYDVYRTAAAELGVGNGLGGRTTGAALAGYQTIIYRSGANDRHTLSAGDYDYDPGNDLAAMAVWLGTANRQIFLSGDGLAADLALNQGSAGDDFLATRMGVQFQATAVQLYIGNQVRPLVFRTPGSAVFSIYSWAIDGGCPQIRSIDAVTALPGAMRLAEFGTPNGEPGAYPYAAATLNWLGSASKAVLSLPYDIQAITAPPGAGPTWPADYPGQVLQDVLTHWGHIRYDCRGPVPDEVPERRVFSVQAAPNPFNPATRLDYTVAVPGRLIVKLYNVRGQLVRVLLDEQVAADGFVLWDGKDDRGAQLASGVYFSEAKMGGLVKITKLALIK